MHSWLTIACEQLSSKGMEDVHIGKRMILSRLVLWMIGIDKRIVISSFSSRD